MTARLEHIPGRQKNVVFFCMPEVGHLQRLRALISGLTASGMRVHVFTHAMFRSQVEREGGHFFDLFSEHPLERADSESIPIPCRFVTFAGEYAESIRREVEKTKPSLIVHDTFAVIGQVVASLLDVPRVNVCAGHNLAPGKYLTILQHDPRVKISPRCLHAVDVLRESYGVADASPFSYISSLSPHLNIYCEPPEFLAEGERQVFEPIAFYGSLSAHDQERDRSQESRSWSGPESPHRLKIYVSFGTVVWRYYAADALRALATLSAAFAARKDVSALISLGGIDIGPEAIARLRRPNVRVESYVDQWEILQESDAFLTHQGMNSTHEAIFHRVPMISYPFFWDQPDLARKCQQLGLALPLTLSPRGEFNTDQVHTVLERLIVERDPMLAALSLARGWEQAVVDGRRDVHRRMIDLIGRPDVHRRMIDLIP